MAKFLLFVTSGPENQAAYSALNFAKAVTQKHELVGVFFYGEGVYNLNGLMCPPTDEINIAKEWLALTNQSVRLIACSAAAQRRGMLNKQEAEYHGVSGESLFSPCEIAGLGELIVLQQQVDKVVQF
ncbi:sulfurtransferase complex subunit TusD [Saccharobesus litoralis]|uniref:Sulfurtransferase complex subunit TusD n=1 Tax=Saccharobesus litoralis TaxID=2172099 RepID=A0A2S0VVI4_9ALTE|nr:sulfurtransferase complex subunit TusD [Saccharobesus litoralis]AWB68120.1 sulfurtransferase complex subunit TusD [Saccharobesus litoralis]